MLKHIITYSILISFLTSCQNKVNNKLDSQNSQVNDSIEIKLKNRSYSTSVSLTNEGKKYIQNWEYYFTLKDFLDNYKKVDYKTSLFHSQQLAILTQQLKDSLKIEKINNPSFKSRINTINSISLRLADMDSIPAITQTEVISETNNLFNAFDGLTIKINSLARKNNLDEDLKEFDFLFSKKDSLDSKDKITDKKVKKTKPKKIERIKPFKNKLNE